MSETPNMGFYRGSNDPPPPMVTGPDGLPSVSSSGPQDPSVVGFPPTFHEDFAKCMERLRLPLPPSTWFEDATGLVGAATAMQVAAEALKQKLGREATIGDLVEAGDVGADLAVFAGVLAAFYAGSCLGCLEEAGIDADMVGPPSESVPGTHIEVED